MPFCSTRTLTSPPSLRGLWRGGAWGLEWALGLCKQPILINFAWGEREAERGPERSWEVWPCLVGGFPGPWRLWGVREGYGLGLLGSTDSRVRPGEGVGAVSRARGAGTAQGRTGDLWGFRVRGARQSRVFASPQSVCRSGFCWCKGESGSLRSSPSPISEVAEPGDPVHRSFNLSFLSMEVRG